jgi:hypothetical protein
MAGTDDDFMNSVLANYYTHFFTQWKVEGADSRHQGPCQQHPVDSRQVPIRVLSTLRFHHELYKERAKAIIILLFVVCMVPYPFP